MDDGRAMTKLGLSLVAIALLRGQSAQDPADLLEQARDKLIPKLPRGSRFSCVATIDRRYFSRKNAPFLRPSCERLSGDRKAGRTKLQLDKTDRLRVKVELTQGDEIYSWTSPGAFSRNVDEILKGPAGTGEFGAYLFEIFSNPAAQFRVLRENETKVEYGFRVPIEASNNLFWDGAQWRAAGYDGSFVIDPASLELQQVKIETGELPPETAMCEAIATLDFPSGSAGMLLPSRAESHFVMRDTTETERVTTFSDCRSSVEAPVQRPLELLIPIHEGLTFKLELTTPIDTATAAAGDVVRAKLAGPALGIPPEATFTGRIMRMEYIIRRADFHTGPYFLIWIVFDRIEAKGVVSSFQARLLSRPQRIIDGHESERAFAFERTANFKIPAGSTSTWVTLK
jgi:hypothetical protein